MSNKRQWWEPKPAVDGRSTDLDRPFDYTHDNLGDALDQLDALSADWIALRARCERLEGALAEIDRCFCPMAVSHPWVRAGLDSARKVLEDGA